ncbi:pro-sigmaK processing inhibitor BofA family protein [Paenibacillus thailandensis]|uniref:Pro-sigmaK processing inhibitor BofA family protein n=1 Tax=Paenibacillus thailandensis TaxID=393250 RepID=A0ABW5R2T1_9BACL
MKTLWLVLFVVSSLMLLFVLVRHRVSWRGLSSFCVHFLLAAAALYVLNDSGIIPGVQIPLNPVTIGTAVVLGLPGVALMIGVQWFIV